MAGKEKKSSENKFSIDKFRENSMALFRVSKSTFDGATDGLDGEYTATEIETKIKTWLKKPIKGGK